MAFILRYKSNINRKKHVMGNHIEFNEKSEQITQKTSKKYYMLVNIGNTM